jgi:hypothetical protein
MSPRQLMAGGTLWVGGAILAVLVFLAVAKAPNVSRVVAHGLAMLGIDSYFTMPPAFWAAPLSASAGLATAAMISMGLLWVATQWTKLVFRWSRSQGRLSRFARWFDHPRWFRRYWPALIAAVMAPVLPWLAAVLLPLGPASVVAVETTFLLMVGVFVVGVAGIIAVGIGAHGLGLRRQLLFAVIGLVHAGLQVATPTLIALLALSNPWIPVVEALAIAAFTMFTRRHLSTPRPRLHLALWLACGATCLALPLLMVGSRPLPLFGIDLVIGVPLAALCGAVLSTTWLGWYLTVTMGFSGHNNEAGAAARVDQFREFIRFRLEPDRIVGHVIGVGRPSVVDGKVVVPTWLIDRFTVGPTAKAVAHSAAGDESHGS